jgi:hypothetical protein
MKITTDEHQVPIVQIQKQSRIRPVGEGRVTPALSITKAT